MTSAADLRRHLDRLYEQGHVEGVDGDHVPLDPHGLCELDGREIRDLAIVRPRGLVIVDDLWMPPVRLAVAYVERNLDWELLPDAMTRAFRWKRPRTLPGRRLRGAGEVAVLRRPVERPDRYSWDRFVPFT